MRLLQAITDNNNMLAAWRSVRAKHGAPGADQVSIRAYEERLNRNLGNLSRSLLDETYVPAPLRRASIPKRNGGRRELAIPAVADRIAQRAVLNVLGLILDRCFLPCSFGYRAGTGVREAIGAVLRHNAEGYPWILDADVLDFFPSVDHSLLLDMVRCSVGEPAVLRLIALWLESGVQIAGVRASPSLAERISSILNAAKGFVLEIDQFREIDHSAGRHDTPPGSRLACVISSRKAIACAGIRTPILGTSAVVNHVAQSNTRCEKGTAQGGPISPLLSNVYLHAFDRDMTRRGLRLVRYADDFVVCCASKDRASQARQIAEESLSRLRLTFNPAKTRIVRVDDGLRFLGYEFGAGGAVPYDSSKGKW